MRLGWRLVRAPGASVAELHVHRTVRRDQQERRGVIAGFGVFCFSAVLTMTVSSQTSGSAAPSDSPAIRVATFNIWELSREKLDQVDATGAGCNVQLRGAAEIIQRVRPDILLINEIDHDAGGSNVALFQDRYLSVAQRGQPPIHFAHTFFDAVNTGVPTGRDLDHDGSVAGAGDAYGFGAYPGQYGIAVLSRCPIDADSARTFRHLVWYSMPGNLMPDGSDGKPNWYAPQDARMLRLSSKSHWDVTVRVDGVMLHLLCSHPTPPIFDGDEDRNGRRNFDEIRFWADYLTGGAQGAYIVDDAGMRGPLPPDAPFVILGDMNADPDLDPSPYQMPAIRQLLRHPRIIDPAPSSAGGLMDDLPGPPTFRERRTTTFGRIDYVLPSRSIRVTGSGVFWPTPSDPLHDLVSDRARSSDHRLVWVDLTLPVNRAATHP